MANRFAHLIPAGQGAAPPQNRFAHLIPKATPQAVADGKGNRELSWADTGIDAAKSLGAGLVRGATGLAGLPGDIGRLAITGMGKLNNTDPAEVERLRQNFPIPGSADITGAVERNLTGPLHESRSTVGDYAETIGEFAPALVSPGGVIRKVATTIVPAITTQAAGDIPGIKGTAAEPYARVLGAVAGGGLANIRKGANLAKNLADIAPPKEVIKKETDAVYKQLRDADIKYDANAYQSMAANLTRELKHMGVHQKLTPNSHAVLNDIIDQVGNSPDYNTFEQLRQQASMVASSGNPLDKLSIRDAAFASKIVEKLDNFAKSTPYIHNGTAPNAPALMKEARELASRTIKARRFDLAVERARDQASGFENGLRIHFRALKRDKSFFNSLSPVEKKMVSDIVSGTTAQNILAQAGRTGIKVDKLGSFNTLIPALITGSAYTGGDIVSGLSIVAGGTAAKYAAAKNAEKIASRASQAVMTGKKVQNQAAGVTRQNLIKARLRTMLNSENAYQQSKGKPVMYSDAKGNQYGYDGKRLSASP